MESIALDIASLTDGSVLFIPQVEGTGPEQPGVLKDTDLDMLG